MRRLFSFGLIFILAGCSTYTPPTPKSIINFTWRVTPDMMERTVKEVEMGDVVMTWTADVMPTHLSLGVAPILNFSDGDTPNRKVGSADSVIYYARAKSGNRVVYCTETSCYEDRDADGALDVHWDIIRDTTGTGSVVRIEDPNDLLQPVPLEPVEATQVDQAIFSQIIALIYDGPAFALPDSDLERLDVMLCSFVLGWVGNDTAFRDAKGVGIRQFTTIPGVYAQEKDFTLTVEQLDLSLSVKDARVDGFATIEVRAGLVDEVDFSGKFDYSTNVPDDFELVEPENQNTSET